MPYYHKKEYRLEKKNLIKMWGKKPHEEDTWLICEDINDAFDSLRRELIEKYLPKYGIKYKLIYDYNIHKLVEEKQIIIGSESDNENELIRKINREEDGGKIEIIEVEKLKRGL
jgi:hypothetical protein